VGVRREKPTYWHLAEQRRVPSRYEVVSSRLHYSTQRGLAVNTPAGRWSAEHQQTPELTGIDWESFADPRRTTYASYVSEQRDNEAHLSRLLERGVHQAPVSESHAAWLARAFSPLRFVYHGLMMAAGHAGSLAPSGRITLVFAFQAGNELQRVQTMAKRLAQLRVRMPTLGDDGRQVFEHDEAWQPLRAALETLLATYAWARNALLLSLLFKPFIDHLAFSACAETARAQGDDVSADLLLALGRESAWERACAAQLLELVTHELPQNHKPISTWLQSARSQCALAQAALAPVLGAGSEQALARVDASIASLH
jgi:toluene monooxygenase system protein E